MSKNVLVARVEIVLNTENASEAADIVSALLTEADRNGAVIDWMHLTDFRPATISDDYEEGDFFNGPR